MMSCRTARPSAWITSSRGGQVGDFEVATGGGSWAAAGDSLEAIYAGKELDSGERVFWKVQVWDRDGNPSTYSDPSFFEMGLTKQSDWRSVPARRFRRPCFDERRCSMA